ncbi:MAG TPA: AraC family transcriptional regulator [Gemmatimonadales bacterium]|nr:AraC family transcriptional regulator [Gemmatimonadales bacterium]
MSVVAALLDSPAALLALRRTLPRGGPRVVACRGLAALHRVLEARLIDAVVLTPQPALLGEIAELGERLPEVPVVGYGAFRADDGELLVACVERSVAALAVEGVDDAVVGELVMRASATARRREALADAPRVLRLNEPLQRRAWEVLLAEVETPMPTASLARRLAVSREHLSRQFGAGGAPNLKRVIDLTRIACAAQLLQNPGYTTATAVKVLRFASPSHLNATARRIAGVPARELGALGPRGVLAAFVRGKTRSRAGGTAGRRDGGKMRPADS